VIQYSESAVIEIGKRFVSVTRKTRKQVEQALGMLEHAGAGGKPRESRPLPELASAYEELAAKIAASLSKVAETAEALEKRHETVRKDFEHVDTLLDQLAAHDSQIGVLALNTSVKGQDVVSVSDQIRTLSLESKALTRDIRRTLEQVRGQATTTHSAVRNAVAQAREAASFASVEGQKLGREMLFNTQEVAETLSQIGALGGEIQKDINEIIVALQFQDITQQKLQRLKDPMLSDLMTSLRAIFDETRSLSVKLEGSGLVEQGGAPMKNAPEGASPEAGPGGPRKGDERVEIF
jgi:methyl-accepting chemotaxis protein